MRGRTRAIVTTVIVVLVGGGSALAIGLRAGDAAASSLHSRPPAPNTTAPMARSTRISGSPTLGHVSAVMDVTCSGTTCVASGTSPSGDPVIWWSSDDGVTFHPSKDAIAATVTLGSVACQARTCVVTGLGPSTSQAPYGTPVAFASTNGGRTFAPTTLPAASGENQLSCSRVLCVLAEQPSPTGGEAPVLVASDLLGSWTQLHLPFAAAVPKGSTAPTTNILASSGLGACAETGPCLLANVTRTVMGGASVPTVWALTGPRAAPVVVATSSATGPLGLESPSCGIATCATLVPRSATTLVLDVATTRTHASHLSIERSAAQFSDVFTFPQVLSCADRSCIVAAPAKTTPARLWAASAHGRLSQLHDPLPTWIQLGSLGAAEPTRGTLLVPAPAHDGSKDASLLRLSLSTTRVAPEGFVTLPDR